MASRQKDYFGLNRVVSIIFAIIPVTSWVCGFVTRFLEGNLIAGILRVILVFTGIGGFIIWLVDLIKIITEDKIWRLIK